MHHTILNVSELPKFTVMMEDFAEVCSQLAVRRLLMSSTVVT
jgi:hypothetical protein